jgi:eukaryotic-like serine/threonine-protein kinase
MKTPASRRIGPYTLIRRLGRGGMAEVFAAVHHGAVDFRRPVCVKRILPDISWDREFKRLFLREISIAGQLIHSNIVQVFDCIEEERNLGLVMELVDGVDLGTLSRKLRRVGSAAPQGIVAYICGQALLGLGFAHRRGIVHRDISPENILVSRFGEVKIVDFGLAKAMTTLATLNSSVVGKLSYMSPEQARGDRADHRGDLFSAGVIFHELLTGRKLFDVQSQGEACRVIAAAKLPPLEGVDPSLAKVVTALLQPTAQRRPQRAEEALAALPNWEVCGPRGARATRELVRWLVPTTIDEQLGLAGPNAPRGASESTARGRPTRGLERMGS